MTAQIALDFCLLDCYAQLSDKTPASLAARTVAWDSTACLGRADVSGRRSRLFGFQRKPQTIRGISFLLAGGDSGFSLHLSPAAGLCSSTTSSSRSTFLVHKFTSEAAMADHGSGGFDIPHRVIWNGEASSLRGETCFWMVARGP